LTGKVAIASSSSSSEGGIGTELLGKGGGAEAGSERGDETIVYAVAMKPESSPSLFCLGTHTFLVVELNCVLEPWTFLILQICFFGR
jgi:hypothetical protein